MFRHGAHQHEAEDASVSGGLLDPILEGLRLLEVLVLGGGGRDRGVLV